MKMPTRSQHGFTIVELLVVMGMTAILLAISVVALSRPQAKNSVETTTITLVSDLKDQQLLSMMGDSGSQMLAQEHGIRVTATSYTLFTGSSFTVSTDNFVINFPPGITASSTTLPLDIIFAKRSGETLVINNLKIQDGAGDQKNILVNQLGAVIIN